MREERTGDFAPRWRVKELQEQDHRRLNANEMRERLKCAPPALTTWVDGVHWRLALYSRA
jgi:hypothetical protein